MDRVECWRAVTPQARNWHFRIRHRVFVEEQRVIPITDLDDRDRDRATIHVLAGRGPAAVGTVRLYRTDDGRGRWKGDRLAVLAGHRASMVGARLVRFAVATAAAAGGDVMDAFVQVQNVTFFERLGWDRTGPPVAYHGLPHQPMAFRLADARTLDESDIPDDACLRLPAARHAPSPLIEAVTGAR